MTPNDPLSYWDMTVLMGVALFTANRINVNIGSRVLERQGDPWQQLCHVVNVNFLLGSRYCSRKLCCT